MNSKRRLPRMSTIPALAALIALSTALAVPAGATVAPSLPPAGRDHAPAAVDRSDAAHAAYLPWVAQPPAPPIEPLGQIGGEVTAVAIAGRYAYAGIGGRMVVLDVADPVHPRQVGTTRPVSGAISDIEVAGTRAFVTYWIFDASDDPSGPKLDPHFLGGLQVFDVADPAQPRLLGRHVAPYSRPPTAFGRLAVAGDMILVTDRLAGLWILDVSALPTIVDVGLFAASVVGAWGIVDVVTDGRTAWTIVNSATSRGVVRLGFLAIDLSDPANPRAGTPLWFDGASGGYDTAMARHGPHVFVGDGGGGRVGNGLYAFDITEPMSPRMACAPGDFVQRLGQAVSQGVSALAVTPAGILLVQLSKPGPGSEPQTSGLYAIDVRDLNRMSIAGAMPVLAEERWSAMSVSDQTIVMARPRGMVHILNLAGIANPMSVGQWIEPIASIQRIAAGEAGIDFAIVDRPGLAPTVWAIDTSDAAWPRAIAEVPGAVAGARDIATRGDYLYVATTDGVQIVDVRDPGAMRAAGRLAGRASVQGLALDSRSRLLVVESQLRTGSEGGLRVVDVTEPASPLDVGYVPGNMHVVATAGRYAWVAVTTINDAGQQVDELHLYGLDDPQRPAELGRFAYPMADNHIVAMVADGDHVFVAQLDHGLFVHRYMPGTMTPLRLIHERPERVTALALNGDMLYAAIAQGVEALDLRDLDHPTLRSRWSRFPWKTLITSLAVDRGSLLVGTTNLDLGRGSALPFTGWSGLLIFDADDFVRAR